MPARQHGYHARKGLEERCEAVVRQQDEERYQTQGWIEQWNMQINDDTYFNQDPRERTRMRKRFRSTSIDR